MEAISEELVPLGPWHEDDDVHASPAGSVDEVLTRAEALGLADEDDEPDGYGLDGQAWDPAPWAAEGGSDMPVAAAVGGPRSERLVDDPTASTPDDQRATLHAPTVPDQRAPTFVEKPCARPAARRLAAALLAGLLGIGLAVSVNRSEEPDSSARPVAADATRGADRAGAATTQQGRSARAEVAGSWPPQSGDARRRSAASPGRARSTATDPAMPRDATPKPMAAVEPAAAQTTSSQPPGPGTAALGAPTPPGASGRDPRPVAESPATRADRAFAPDFSK